MTKPISLADAAKILTTELNYAPSRAMQFVLNFDKNGDGWLDADEFFKFSTTLKETRQQMTQKFKECDSDNSGLVSLDEAKQVLKKHPFNFPDEKVNILLKQFDRDGNSELDVDEFIGFYAEAKAISDDIGKRFDALDTDGNGLLSPSELVGVIKETLGYDEDHAHKLLSTFDENNDGNIDKKEFVNMWAFLFK